MANQSLVPEGLMLGHPFARRTSDLRAGFDVHAALYLVWAVQQLKYVCRGLEGTLSKKVTALDLSTDLSNLSALGNVIIEITKVNAC